MKRIIGTILTEQNDGPAWASLVHDDETGEFVGRLADGTEEPLADWSGSLNPEVARQAAFAWYRPLGEFDPWHLWLAAD